MLLYKINKENAKWNNKVFINQILGGPLETTPK